MDSQSHNQPKAQSLEDPFYYLANANTLVHWVMKLHADLLDEDETVMIGRYLSLPQKAQALLIRMIMRTQTIYRASQLQHYTEIGSDLDELLNHLEQSELIERDPPLELKEVATLLNREELLALAQQIISTPLAKSSSKRVLLERLNNESLAAKPLSEWLTESTDSLKLNCQPLFDRLRLMFFGNLRQSWSEFVVTELGYFNYEPIQLDESSRAFHHRTEVDQYLALNEIYEESETTSLTDRILRAQRITPINSWIAGRHGRLLFNLGQEAERAGEVDTALSLYQASNLGDALIRELRLLEKSERYEAIAPRITGYRQESPYTPTPLQELLINRVEKRLSKKLSTPFTSITLKEPERINLTIPKLDTHRVEQTTALALRNDSNTLFYVENCLINSMFGLLFWEVLYAPIPGAFFHPFQAQPADLYRSNFKELRADLIQECFNRLDNGDYKSAISDRYQEKYGITNSFIHWGVVSNELLEMALEFIPAQHLKKIFERLLSDLRNHRSGFPDLIEFNLTERSYRLTEVKGPGDRLQDNQKLWLDYFVEQQIPSAVCWVEWQQDDAR
ncbi:MAG: hypothetical protein RL143_654 [Pseudomonadota bacterium]